MKFLRNLYLAFIQGSLEGFALALDEKNPPNAGRLRLAAEIIKAARS